MAQWLPVAKVGEITDKASKAISLDDAVSVCGRTASLQTAFGINLTCVKAA